MRESHSNSEAKITKQKSVISYQQKEIDEYEEKIKNQDEKLKKMQALVAKTNNQLDRNDKENAELKNKINELEKRLKQRYSIDNFEVYSFMISSDTKKRKLVEVDDEESGKSQRKRQNIIK